ncbi:MAG: histidine phosphatase family protein [Gammaproteobacteria bacterium]|nr:histidine phosphatase family protein [Gammaproteobacteria bacterium]
MQILPRQLWLLRHAKAEPYQSRDFERNLADKGIKQMYQLSRQLTELEIPETIVSSPAHRARQTTELFCEHLSINPENIHWDQRLYEASTSQLVSVLQDYPDGSDVMLVAHNPGLEGLAAYLTSGQLSSSYFDDTHFLIKTAMLVRIEMPANWHTLQPGCGKLHNVIHPKHNI